MNLSPNYDARAAAAVTLLLCALALASPSAFAQAAPAVSPNTPSQADAPDVSQTAPAERPAANAAPAAKAQVTDDPEKHLIGGAAATNPTTEEPSAGAGLQPLKVFGGLWPLLAVVAIIVILFLVARKYLPGMKRVGGSATIKVLARTHLSPRHSVAIVRVGRRLLVVGQSPDNLAALDAIVDPQEVSEILGQCESSGAASASAGFSKVYRQTERAFDVAEHRSAQQEVVEEQATQEDVAELRHIRGEVNTLAEKVRQLDSLRTK